MDIRLLTLWSCSLLAMVVALGIVYYSKNSKKNAVRRRRKKPAFASPNPKPVRQEPEVGDTLGLEADDHDLLSTDEVITEAPKAADIAKKAKAIKKPALQVISILLIAEPEHPYRGYELLQSLLSANLRHGEMNIFHRHEHKDGTGEILFSIASVMEPGYFDLDNMGGFKTPGLNLFLQVNLCRDPLNTFELMLETAQFLADELGGEIYDEKKQPLNEHLLEEKRQQLHELDPNLGKSADMFETAGA